MQGDRRPESQDDREFVHGGWLRQERERLALSRRYIAEHLLVSEAKIIWLEQRKGPVPPEWLGTLAAIGFQVPSVPPESAPSPPAPPAPPVPLAPPAPPAPQPPNAALSEPIRTTPLTVLPSKAPNLPALITDYHLTYGRQTHKSPIEILTNILTDLRQASLDSDIQHEDVEHAVRALLKLDR